MGHGCPFAHVSAHHPAEAHRRRWGQAEPSEAPGPQVGWGPATRLGDNTVEQLL